MYEETHGKLEPVQDAAVQLLNRYRMLANGNVHN